MVSRLLPARQLEWSTHDFEPARMRFMLSSNAAAIGAGRRQYYLFEKEKPDMLRNATLILGCLLMLVCATSVRAQVASDVPQDNWAYAAVQDLASKGLVLGYPPSGDFFGKRTVTRYEMATIIDRVLAAVDQKVQAGQSVTPDQLAEVKNLVDQYHVELTVIGTDMQKVQDDLNGVKTQISGLQSGLQGALDNIRDVQDNLKSKVSVGNGTLKITGLFQEWFEAGKYPTGTTTGRISNTFRVRRAEVNLGGNLADPNFYYFAKVDFAKPTTLTATPTTYTLGTGKTAVKIVSTTYTVNNSSQYLQDLFGGYVFKGTSANPGLAVEAGQQKTPLSYEGLMSSGALPFYERAIFNTLTPNNGGVGNLRDVGALVRYNEIPAVAVIAGVFDDSGTDQDTTAQTSGKTVAGNIQYTGIPSLQVGAYGEGGGPVLGNGPSYSQRQVVGGNAIYNFGPNSIWGEYEESRNNVPVIRSQGDYVAYGYQFCPKLQFVTRYEYFNPDRNNTGKKYNKEQDLDVGANLMALGNNARFQLDYIRKNITGPSNTNDAATLTSLGPDRSFVVVTAQQSF